MRKVSMEEINNGFWTCKKKTTNVIWSNSGSSSSSRYETF